VWAAGPQGFLQEYIDCDDFKCWFYINFKGKAEHRFLEGRYRVKLVCCNEIPSNGRAEGIFPTRVAQQN